MPRPLLTDEIIEQAKQDKERIERELQREMENDREISEKYDKIEQDLSKQAVYKSRRIENVKQQRRSKLINKWLLIVTIIVVIFLIAFILYYF
ncbi:cell wall synthase accessory phosphoprotein MacP [Lactococcus nasutitermitis]|uniref:Cell wall synthase accessory phosphoprotein MacP n=1 Tax=Lactococcus nasutitermitis TaxID=1652957 RepID=A0ABV9J9K8_9LACT|nr:cell wall synthase accessory phosphoprotein MacP [Lactococcus nasutitermitis]